MQCPFRKLAVRIMANIASQHPPGQPTGSAPVRRLAIQGPPARIAAQKAHNAFFMPAPARRAVPKAHMHRICLCMFVIAATSTASQKADCLIRYPTESPCYIAFSGTHQDSLSQSLHGVPFQRAGKPRSIVVTIPASIASQKAHIAILHCFFRHLPGQPYRKPTWTEL